MSENSKKRTLCLICQKAGGNCSWSKDFTPVEGWNAKPTKIRCREQKTGYIDSYHVIECPEFELLDIVKINEIEREKWLDLIVRNMGGTNGV